MVTPHTGLLFVSFSNCFYGTFIISNVTVRIVFFDRVENSTNQNKNKKIQGKTPKEIAVSPSGIRWMCSLSLSRYECGFQPVKQNRKINTFTTIHCHEIISLHKRCDFVFGTHSPEYYNSYFISVNVMNTE